MVSFSCVIFIPILFYFDLTVTKVPSNNSSSAFIETSVCTYSNSLGTVLVSTINMVMRIIIPFILMIILSILLIISVFKLRNRISRNFLAISKKQVNENNRLKKEMKLAVTSIMLNILYLVFNLPIAVYVTTPNFFLNNLLFSFLLNFYFLSIATNFYMAFISNRLVRSEFLNLFNFKVK